MKSMKLNKRETKLQSEPMEIREEYPYGLRLNLDNDSLKKLSIKTLPEVGSYMTLTAKVEVSSISENQHEGDEELRRDMSLQITDMELAPEKSKPSMSETLYGK